MSKKRYVNLLRGDYKALGYYADEVFDACSDYDFFVPIAKYIVPLIRGSQAFNSFYFQCVKAKDAHLKEKNDLEIKAPKEVEETFRSLQLDLRNKSFLGSSEVEQCLVQIQKIFDNKQRYGTPSYIQLAYEAICRLLEKILDIGETDFVRKYATLECRTVQIHIGSACEIKEVQKWYINTITFAPSLVRINEIQDAFSRNDVKDAWIAFEQLILVEWCWNTPFSFFGDKELCHDDYLSNNESMKLLVLHDYWIELNNIKEQNADSKAIFFSRLRFAKFLTLILNAILLEQETKNKLDSSDRSSEDEIIVPSRVTLRLEHIWLLLDVRWFVDGEVNTYLIHAFQHDSSGPYLLMKAFLASPDNAKIDIRKVCDVSGASIAKHLEGMNLNNILGRLFIDRTKHKKTYTAAMKCKNMDCDKLSKADQLELTMHIKSLRLYKPCSVLNS